MEATIWQSIQNPTLKIKFRQFLYKGMTTTQKVGDFSNLYPLPRDGIDGPHPPHMQRPGSQHNLEPSKKLLATP